MSWQTYNQSILRYPQFGFSLDLSLMEIGADFVAGMSPKINKAFDDMKALEAGAIANPDENRRVGHYWLRNADLAPTPELREAITAPLADLKNSPPKFTPAKSLHLPVHPSNNSSSSASAVQHSARNSSPKRSALTQSCRSFSSTIPIPPAWTQCWKKSNRSALPTRSC